MLNFNIPNVLPCTAEVSFSSVKLKIVVDCVKISVSESFTMANPLKSIVFLGAKLKFKAPNFETISWALLFWTVRNPNPPDDTLKFVPLPLIPPRKPPVNRK